MLGFSYHFNPVFMIGISCQRAECWTFCCCCLVGLSMDSKRNP